MFANFLIGLREGLEAALIVSILIAYLVKTDRREAIPAVWVGVGIAVALSVAFGALLTFTSSELDERGEEIFAGALSFVAVVFVTWMVFWMKRTARNLKGELHGRLDKAFAAGAVALATVAFLAVAREGLETSLFLWTAIRSTGEGTAPLAGGILGLAAAVVLGWLFYRGALRINLATFFSWTGAFLIIIAAGVLAYGIHEWQEAGLLPGEDAIAFDISGAVPADSLIGTLMRGIFNISPVMSWLQVIAWLAYVAIVMTMFFWGSRTARPVATAAAPATTAAPAPATDSATR